MSVKIVNKIKQFASENVNAMDRALNKMAIDIERLSKEQVPHRKGQLKASGHHTRLGHLRYEMSYNKIYARFQEFGGDDTRRVRKYSKPGKKRFFLRDPGRTISQRAVDYFKEQVRTIRV